MSVLLVSLAVLVGAAIGWFIVQIPFAFFGLSENAFVVVLKICATIWFAAIGFVAMFIREALFYARREDDNTKS